MRLSNRSERAARLRSGAVALAFVLAACSSDSAGPDSEPPVRNSSPPASVEAPESTTTTSTTSTTTDSPLVIDTVLTESSESVPDTTVTDPIPAPTSAMFDPVTPSGEAEQAALANLAAIKTCAQELPSCDIDSLTRFSALDYKAGNVELISGFNTAGYEVRNPDDYFFQVLDLELSEDGTEAVVLACIRDGSQLVAPATDSAPERIIDGGNVSRKDKYLVRRLGDVWLVTARDPIEREAGIDGGFCE